MTEKFECKRDNLTIRGTVYRLDDTKRPAIILSHGFMANQKSVKTYAKIFMEMGYAAFAYDFNGGGIFSKSDGKSQNMTVFTEVEDLFAVIEHVKKCSYVDSEDITLLGCSQGGFVSGMVAARRDDIGRLIMLYPALCIPDDARAGTMLGFKFDTTNIPDILSRFPMKIGGNYAKVVMDKQFEDLITGYDGPVLLIHGTKDPIVNIDYSRRAKECYANCTYYEIEGAGHGFRRKYDKMAIEYLKSIKNAK